jgi:hypothetical protein
VEFAGITAPWFTAALIICHSATEYQTFSLAATANSISPSALWLAPLMGFCGLMIGFFSASNSSDVSFIMTYT